MTSPDNTSPGASGGSEHLGALTAVAALALIDRHARGVLALEHATARAVVTPVRAAAVALSRWSAARWVAAAGGLHEPLSPIAWAAMAPEVMQRMRVVRPAPAPLVAELTDRLGRAYDLGTAQSARTLDVHPAVLDIRADDVLNPEISLPGHVAALAGQLDTAITARWDSAEQMLVSQPVETFDQLSSALAPTHAAGSDVDRDARTAVNVAVATAAHDAATATGAQLLWIAERDACVVCLALSGHVVGADEAFDPDATFGDRAASWWRPPGTVLYRPPRHPRCRCRCEPWLGHSGPGIDLPAALRREAQRSILRGDRRPSESETVRLRAADRLLSRGTSLPKTVQARARAAVDRGSFTIPGRAHLHAA